MSLIRKDQDENNGSVLVEMRKLFMDESWEMLVSLWKHMFYFFARDKQDGLLTRYPNLKRDEVSEILKCFWRTNMQIMRWKYCITFYVFYNKQEDRAPLTQTQKVLLLMEICFPSEPFPLCMRLMAEASKKNTTFTN